MIENPSTSLLHRYNPAVSQRWLLLISGLLWTGVGIMLVSRSISWLPESSIQTGTWLEIIACLVAACGYKFGFSKVVEKNERRILSLPPKACIFAFTAWRGYLMIGGMVTMGILLRNSSLPKAYLILP